MTNPDQPDQPDRVEHRMERTYEVAATPEQVWDAIATADGIAAWMVPTRLDPQIGGEVSFDLGEFRSTGVVTDYTPNHRFAYEEPWPIADQVEAIPAAMVEWFNAIGVPLSEVYHDLSSVTPIAPEFLVESASGGTSAVGLAPVVNSARRGRRVVRAIGRGRGGPMLVGRHLRSAPSPIGSP